MKVLLLNPLYRQPVSRRHERYFVRSGSRWPHSGVKLKGAIAHYLPFPFSLAYAAAYLKKASLDVRVIDAVALNLPEEKLLGQVASIRPELVFYELTTPTVDFDLSLAEKIKKASGARLAVGGPHADYFAAEILKEHQAIDFVIRGDYENILTDLAQSLANGSAGDVPGVVRLNRGSVVDNGCLLNEAGSGILPVPLRGIFPANDRPDPTVYWDGFCQYRPALQVQSSRGCEYGCSFCLGAKQKPRRVAGLQQLCDDIQKGIREYSIREVYFDDDNFTQEMGHVDRIFKSLQERKLRIKWSGMASFSTLTPEIIQRLSGYGCIGLKLGIESASKQVLQSMHKPVDLNNVSGILAACRKYGIKTHLTFIIGFLNETFSDIKETVSYARSLDADSIQVSIATPMPGTEFFETAKSSGLLTQSGWRNYDAKRTSVIRPLGFNGKTLGRIRRDFLRDWYLRKLISPRWLKNHFPVIFRTLKGLGFIFFCKQLAAVFIDESKNG